MRRQWIRDRVLKIGLFWLLSFFLSLTTYDLRLTTYNLPLPSVFAAEPYADDALQFARGEYYLTQREFARALEQFGQLPKELQGDLLFQQRVEKAFAAIYSAKSRAAKIALGNVRSPSKAHIEQQIRVTHRKQDAERLSDQSSDNRGWQVNEHLSSEMEGRNGLRGRFALDLDGFKNGHNDLRYRTLLADFFQGPSHLALGDSATYTSPYFLRGSRFRGANLLLKGETNEFQALAGAYPVWLESRDEYIYPRTVWGIRDRIQILEDRVKLGINLVQTRDSEKIRTADGANPSARVDLVFQPRDNVVFSLDQEIKLIPDVWSLKVAQGYSTTDDNLLEDRFGNTTKLKDSAFQVESLLIQPLFRWRSYLERVGPDYRVLTDLPQGAVNSPKDIRADVMRMTQALDLNPFGPLDLDLEASWARNNLDNDDTLEHTRQAWYTANIGFLTPSSWPRPRLRASFIETLSSPGSTMRPSQTKKLDLRSELSHQWKKISFSEFATYEGEHPSKDEASFDEEERWSLGLRAARPLGNRLLVSSFYQYLTFDQLFDATREDGLRHEANLSGSMRLISTSNLSLSYTFFHGKLSDPTGTKLTHMEGHAGALSGNWPYTWIRWDKRRKLTLLPGVSYHLTDLDRVSRDRPLITGRLSLGYEAHPDWKLELMGEYRYDDDGEISETDTQGSRLWLLWTSRWN